MFTNSQHDEALIKSPDKQLTPNQLDKSKSAFLTQTAQEELTSKSKEVISKLDQSKLDFLQKSNEENINENNEEASSKQISPSKLAQIETENVQTSVEIKTVPNQVQEELELLRQLQQQKQDDDNVYENLDTKNDFYEEEDSPTESSENIPEAYEVEDYTKEEILNTGVSAVALYDYQAAADDEISFDPDDIITHIEKVWTFFFSLANIK